MKYGASRNNVLALTAITGAGGIRASGGTLSTGRFTGAGAVIVNTCGFLDSAKAESLDAIGEALAENGRVIVTGCMGAQPEEIREKYPNLLAVTGPQAYESVVAAVHEAVTGESDGNPEPSPSSSGGSSVVAGAGGAA